MGREERRSDSIAIGDERVALADAVAAFVAEHASHDALRRAIAGEDWGSRAFIDHAAQLGWLGLHVPDTCGGQGAGLSEAVIVAEEFGRGLVPGSTTSTMVTATLLRMAASYGSHPRITRTLGQLASGETSGVPVIGPRLDAVRGPDGDLHIGGKVSLTAQLDDASFALIPIRLPFSADAQGPDGGDYLYLIEIAEGEVQVCEPLDPTRSIARLDIPTGTTIDDRGRLWPVDADLIDATRATFVSAESAGIAAWCVQTAARHARERHQFARPIGQFQAVKHRCADMLVSLEAMRALAWDAAAAGDAYFAAIEADADRSEQQIAQAAGEWTLAASAAAAFALDATVDIAQDTIQVLGGIGFTWEHDAHLYLRRAVANRQLLGGSARFRSLAAQQALDRVRRHLRVEVPADAAAERAEIRAVAEELGALEGEAQRSRLVETGWLVPNWPPPWGIAAKATTQLLIDEELRKARVRRPHLQVGAWAAPTIAAHGTDEQQQRWVRPTLLGEISWCQLFSEPDAGSDLASLRTSATRVEGGWSLTGQKVWTTMAREADWGICLARTNPSAHKHAGITYFIVDMKSPGIDIRPLREMTGLEMFNEVFMDEVHVPDDCVIGDVDNGWSLARTTLGNERVAMGSGSSFGGGLEGVLKLMRSLDAETPDGTPSSVVAADPVAHDRLGLLVAHAHAVATLGARATLRSVTGARPGPEASVRKLLGVEHDQRTQEFGLGLLGAGGATVEGDGGTWTFGYLANRCLTIAGGTSEIQRNVIGERLLGLPRDPEVT